MNKKEQELENLVKKMVSDRIREEMSREDVLSNIYILTLQEIAEQEKEGKTLTQDERCEVAKQVKKNIGKNVYKQSYTEIIAGIRSFNISTEDAIEAIKEFYGEMHV